MSPSRRVSRCLRKIDFSTFFFFNRTRCVLQVQRHPERVVANQYGPYWRRDGDHSHRGRVRRICMLRDTCHPKVDSESRRISTAVSR